MKLLLQSLKVIMPPNKRRNRDRVQCMTCQAVINGDEQASHRRRIHQNASVKFKIYLEDTKQQKLCFGNSSKSKQSNDMENVDIIAPAAGDVEVNNEPNDMEDIDIVPQVEGDEEMTVEVTPIEDHQWMMMRSCCSL